MIDENNDKKVANGWKMIYNHSLDKRTAIMKNTQFKIEDVFGGILGRESISPEQITELNTFSASIMKILFLKPGLVCLNLETRRIGNMNRVLVPKIQIVTKWMTKNWCAGERHYSETINQNVFEKVNPKTQKFVEIIKGSCSVCVRGK